MKLSKHIGLIVAIVFAAMIVYAETSTMQVSVPSTTTYSGYSTNNVYGAATIVDGDFQSFRLWMSGNGTNATTIGSWKIYYALSWDGLTFTTVNSNRFVEITPRGVSNAVNSVLIDASGVKAIMVGPVEINGANGMTNLEARISARE